MVVWHQRVDRIVMLLTDQKNIREITLFPMNQNAEDLLMGAPSEIDQEQLKSVSIKIDKKKINFLILNLFLYHSDQLI